MIETLSVIHIFHQVTEELTFFTKIPIAGAMPFKGDLWKFRNITRKISYEDYCPEERSTKTSTATCFLISCMPFLLSIYIATGSWKNAHFLKHAFNYSEKWFRNNEFLRAIRIHDLRISPLEYTLSEIACSELTEL